MIMLLLLGGSIFASVPRSPVIVADVMAQDSETSLESADVDAEGKRSRIEKIMRQGKQRLKSLKPEEIRELGKGKDQTIELRPERDGKDCKDDKKDKDDVMVGTLTRDITESIGFNEGHFTNVRPGEKVMVPMPANCVGGSHLYIALQYTFVDAPGYVQVTDFVSGSSASLPDC